MRESRERRRRRGYWSSSEYDVSLAWREFFDGGSQVMLTKFDELRVRAVRAF